MRSGRSNLWWRLLSLRLSGAFFILWLLALPVLGDGLEEEPFVRVDHLNTGFPDFARVASAELDTPESTLGFFVRRCRAGEFEMAARALNLDRLDPNEQGERGPALARQLYLVMERKTGFPFDLLPDRSDGRTDLVASDKQGPRPRRAFLLGTLPLRVGQFEVYLVRYRTPELDSVWLFAPNTVKSVGLAYQAHGPTPWERKLPDFLRAKPIWNTPLWGWLAMLAAITLSLAGSRLFNRVLLRKVDYRLVGKLSGGVPVACAGGLSYLVLRPWVPLPGPVLALLLTVGFCALVWMISTTLNHYSEQIVRGDMDSVKDLDATEHSYQKKQLTYLSVGRRLLSSVVLALGLGALFINSPKFEAVGLSILASAGVLSVLLGIAAQPLLGNMLAGAQIAISRPIRVGDAIDFEGTWCYVEDITYMYVLCCTWDERRLVIPLRYFISKPFASYSLRDPHTLRMVELRLDYLADVKALRKHYRQVAQACELWDSTFEPKMEVVHCGERTIKVRALVSARNASDAWDLHCHIREELLAYVGSHDKLLPRFRVDEPPSERIPDRAPILASR